MKKIEFTDSHRKKHFDFFRRMDQPHFGVTVNVDITLFAKHIREAAEWRFTPAFVYLLARVANELPNFRRRIRNDEVVEHPSVQPSFAVPTKDSEVFSFCTVDYHPDAREFHRSAIATMEEMFTNPSFEDEPGRDDYLFMSTFPWASFTSVQHAMHYSPADSVPRIIWGKYFKQGDQLLMPLAVQAHHAVVDGRDMGKYYQEMELLLKKVKEIFPLD
ncbi:MAG: chloramphenicol acetyltransferase [Bacteroidota bacterium]